MKTDYKGKIRKAVIVLAPSMFGVRKDKLVGMLKDESTDLLNAFRIGKGVLKHFVWRLQIYLSVNIADDNLDRIQTVGDLFDAFVAAMDEEAATVPAQWYMPSILDGISGSLLARQFSGLP